MEILLTKSTMPLVKYFAHILGWLMTGIFEVLDKVGIPNVGIAIILYTIIVYVLMTPLQIQQQKSSKMMAVINPEVQEIQKKYKGKKTQEAQMAMQQEVSAVYEKYGVSQMGSCGTLLIQMPLLFALYQVIYHIPGYISKVGGIFAELTDKILAMPGDKGLNMITQFIADNKINVFGGRITDTLTNANVTDFLYVLKPSQWVKFAQLSEMSQYKDLIESTARATQKINSFGGIQISMSPMDVIREGIASKSFLLIVAAIAVPVLAWFTQWLNYKLMPQSPTANSNNANDPMASSMKTMGTTMPIFSAVLCVTFSYGIGIYWIAGAVIRCIQQVVINQKIAQMDTDELIKKAQEKAAKKRAKKGDPAPNTIRKTASTSTRNVTNSHMKANIADVDYAKHAENARPDSITARANMVQRFNEKNSKKK
ncbi:MAG: YidC/Oxa1 family membrane protein insertase [Lachnospiraceae bacterium]|nr:YidC/Oxa1 family membrane protein insertase [Lachnospiraceae bacterium]